MKRNVKKFEQQLMIYGADLDNWPETLQVEALMAKRDPDLILVWEAHKRMEEKLRSYYQIEPAHVDFAQRIINAAQVSGKKTPVQFTTWLNDMFNALFPKPAFALALALSAGLAIGVNIPSETGSKNTLQLYFDDEANSL